MRIAHLVGSLETRYGGPSRSVRRLAAATAELGHEVELLTSAPAASAPEQAGGLQIRTWRRGWPGMLCPVPGMAAHLERLACEVVHHHGLWLRPLHYARRKAAHARIPLVISPRGMMSPWAWRHHRTRKALAARFLHPGALAAASGWHATSAEEAGEIRACGYAQPICIAPNGVERPTEGETAAARAHWAARIPQSDTQPVALFYGRFHAKKRIVELIDLWAERAPPGWLLLIVGVPERYSVAQLRDYALRAGASGRIEVHDGLDRPPPYPIASLLLLPSHNENYGLVVAEAMAHGVPVVVTDTTPWRDLTAAGLGWCVPWEDFGTALAAAAREGPARLRVRGAQAREWVLREHAWTRAARLLIDFYTTLQPVTA